MNQGSVINHPVLLWKDMECFHIFDKHVSPHHVSPFRLIEAINVSCVFIQLGFMHWLMNYVHIQYQIDRLIHLSYKQQLGKWVCWFIEFIDIRNRKFNQLNERKKNKVLYMYSETEFYKMLFNIMVCFQKH